MPLLFLPIVIFLFFCLFLESCPFPFILFFSFYMLSVCVLVMPFGVLGLCVEANFERVLSMMSSEPNPCNRLISRLGNVLLC